MRSKHDFPTLNTKDADGIKPSGKPYNVMVVDDKEFHRKQISQILESEGYKILATASNGQEAIELVERHANKLDLITTALDMPVMDVYAFLFELGEKSPRAKIVFINEDTTKGVIEDWLQMGASDYILKPINRESILKRVRQVLKGGKKEEITL